MTPTHKNHANLDEGMTTALIYAHTVTDAHQFRLVHRHYALAKQDDRVRDLVHTTGYNA